MANPSTILRPKVEALAGQTTALEAQTIELTEVYTRQRGGITVEALARLTEQANSLVAGEKDLIATASALSASIEDDAPNSLPPPPLSPEEKYQQTWQATETRILRAQQIADKYPPLAERLATLKNQFNHYLQLAKGGLTSEQQNRLVEQLSTTFSLGRTEPNIWLKTLAEIHELIEIQKQLRNAHYDLASQESKLVRKNITDSSERSLLIKQALQRIHETLKIVDPMELQQLDAAKATLENVADLPTKDDSNTRAARRIDAELDILAAATAKAQFSEFKNFIHQQALLAAKQFDNTAKQQPQLVADEIDKLKNLNTALKAITDQASLDAFSKTLQQNLGDAEQRLTAISQAEEVYNERFEDFGLLAAATAKTTKACVEGTLVSDNERQELKGFIQQFKLEKEGCYVGIAKFKEYQEAKIDIEKNVQLKQEKLNRRKKEAKEIIKNINKLLTDGLPQVDKDLDFAPLFENVEQASDVVGALGQLKILEENLGSVQQVSKKFSEMQKIIAGYKQQIAELHTDDITVDERARLLQQLDQHARALQEHQDKQKAIINEKIETGLAATEAAREIFRDKLTDEIKGQEAGYKRMVVDFADFAPELYYAVTDVDFQFVRLQQCIKSLTDFKSRVNEKISFCEECTELLENYQKLDTNSENIEHLQKQLDAHQEELEKFKKLLASNLQVVARQQAKGALKTLNLVKAELGDLQLAMKKNLTDAVLLANCCVMLGDATIQNESWAQQIVQIGKNQNAALEHLATQIEELDDLEQLPSPVAAEIAEILKTSPHNKLTKEQLTMLPLAEKRQQLLVLINDYQKQLKPLVEGNVLAMAAIPELVQQPTPVVTSPAPVATAIKNIDLDAVEPFLIRMANTLASPLTAGQLFQMSASKSDLLKANLVQDYIALRNLQDQLGFVKQDARAERLLTLTHKLSADIAQRQNLINLREQQGDCFIFTVAQLDAAVLEKDLQKVPEIYFVKDTAKNQRIGELWVFAPGVVAYAPNKGAPNNLPIKLIKQYLAPDSSPLSQIFCYGAANALTPAIPDLYQSAVPGNSPQKVYINDQVVAATKSLGGRGIGFFSRSEAKPNLAIEMARAVDDKLTASSAAVLTPKGKQ